MRKVILIVALFCFSNCHAQEITKVKIADLQKIITESKTPLLVNFWATWCRPCIEEIPYFQEEAKNFINDSFQLILISVDFREEFPNGIQSLAEKRNFNAPIFWLDETNADYFCPKIDAKWSGAVPASLFINNKTGYRKFFEEQLTREKLQNEIKSVIGKN
jgi:thiol-disulfide isomerase/thioredoxin